MTSTASERLAPRDGKLVLGIESSCDETAAAIVVGGLHCLSSVVSSQVDLHARFGGVVPEVASRAHLERILPVITETFDRAGLSPVCTDGKPPVDAVAATVGPGLIGSLLVGISAAKSLALGWGVPFVGVNHLEGHLYAALLEDPTMPLPAVVLIVSGGHSLLVHMEALGSYRVVGQTVDDAAGEAFDKVARYLGLGYPGGPALEKAARDGDPKAIAFPRPMAGDGLDMSFSGLKTAVVHYVGGHPSCSSADVAASFQAAVVDVLVGKALAAARELDAKAICLGGGVAANGPLREQMTESAARAGVAVFLPSKVMCTDNAAMIAAAGQFRLASDGPSPMDIGALPNMAFPTSTSRNPALVGN